MKKAPEQEQKYNSKVKMKDLKVGHIGEWSTGRMEDEHCP